MTKDRDRYLAQLDAGGVVVVESLGKLETLVDQANTHDLEATQGSSPKRQREQLSWRAIARKYFGNQEIILSYNEVRAPQIELVSSSERFYIGVSHSSSHVAVILAPSPCAIDIESLARDFSRVSSRYLSPQELSLVEPQPNHLALAWSTKEALYKFAGRKQLDLLEDIRITRLSEGRFEGTITPHATPLSGIATTILDHSLVYITA